MAFDIDAIKARQSLSDYIGRHVKLRRVGSEMVGLSPFQTERTPSFTVCEAKGFWHDFSSGLHGDLIDFVTRFHNVSFTEACEILGGERTAPTGIKPRAQPDPEPSIIPAPIPADHAPFTPGAKIRAWNPKGDNSGWRNYTPDYVWPYHDPGGELLGYVIRINIGADKKLILPLRPATWGGETRWTVAHLDRPRPLYNIARISPSGPVFLVEGEKPADALTEIMGTAQLSWYGGTNGVAYNDFTPLAGRDVIIWGDADKTGEKAAYEAAERATKAGASSVRVIPWDQSRPQGWDAADAWSDGWAREDVLALTETAEVFLAPPDDPAPPSGDDFDANPFSGSLPPPRPWAFGRMLLHRTVTAIAAPPGTGKSTWAIQLAIAFSQGRAFGGMEPIRTGPAWVWNNEDDADELDRRTLAACYAMDIDPAKLDGKFYLNSGSDRQLIVGREVRHVGLVATPDVERVIAIIKERGIKLLVVDPFAETFEVESENSNDVMKKVARLYRDIAQQADCSVLLIAHTPKGTSSDKSAGSLETIRGGSAIGGVVRSAWTMFEMSEDDAEAVGVGNERRHLYIRLDSAKSNMSLKSPEASWWMREGIAIGNAADGYADDVVGTLRSVEFATPEKKSRDDTAATLDRISAEIVRVCRKNGYTSEASAMALDAVVSALDQVKTGVGKTKARDLITGHMNDVHGHEDAVIVITHASRGKYRSRTIHVEERREI